MTIRDLLRKSQTAEILWKESYIWNVQVVSPHNLDDEAEVRLICKNEHGGRHVLRFDLIELIDKEV